MSDKHLRGPDERFQTTGKDTVHEGQPGIDTNKLKPDEPRPKGEPADDTSEDAEEDE